ncbi:unnamed protein product [Cuscuta epithymum]|uniref:Uncharacterized protein n=1 Tax=Cuscuta epithymum TaxID=186058 RepID=A0AAV0G6N0_9ASTE|nr:unnamed protein product [Cuscuta epithymum]
MEDWGLFWEKRREENRRFCEKMSEDTRRFCEEIRKLSLQRNNRHSRGKSRTKSQKESQKETELRKLQESWKEPRTVSHSRKEWRGKLGKFAEKNERQKVEKEKKPSNLEKEKRTKNKEKVESAGAKNMNTELAELRTKMRPQRHRRGRSRKVRRCVNSKSKGPSQSEDTSFGPLASTQVENPSSQSLSESPELVNQQQPEGTHTYGFSRRKMFSKYDLDQSDLETNRFKLLQVGNISFHLAHKKNWPNGRKTEMMYRQSSNIVLEGLNKYDNLTLEGVTSMKMNKKGLGHYVSMLKYDVGRRHVVQLPDYVFPNPATGNSCLERKRSGPGVLEDRVHPFSWESYAIIQVGVMISHGGPLNWMEGVSRGRVAIAYKGAETAEKHSFTMFQAILKPKIEGLSTHYNSRDHQYYSPVVSFVLVNLNGKEPSILDSPTNLWEFSHSKTVEVLVRERIVVHHKL